MSDQPSTLEERSPWSRPCVLLSGAFLIALAVLGIVLAAAGGGNQSRPQGPPSAASPTAPPRPGRTTATAGGCDLPAGSQAIPWSSPPLARWGTVGSMQVPQNSAVYGPQYTRGVYATCFAHDPAGALLAAINVYAESTTGVPASEVMRRYAVGAPADLGNDSGIDNSGSVQLAGYRYDSYTGQAAEVTIVIQGAQGRLLAVVTSMQWHGGDWKYVFPPAGQPSYQAISDLSGYVSWSAFG
jgi:hypothetical protein